MMAGDKGGGIYTTIGVMPSAMPSNRVLRYCAFCVKEDEVRFGEMYWHRSHQVSGVLMCAKHEIPLTNSSATVVARQNKRHFIDIKSQISDSNSCELVDEKDGDHFIAIAKSVQKLLEYSWTSEGLSDIKHRYLNALKARKLATNSGSVRVREFIDAFRHFYGDDLLEKLNCEVDYYHADSWIMKLVRKPRASMHPVRHILLMRFLGMTPNQFFGQVETYHPFGNGPWLCLNPVANHYGETAITECKVTRDYKSPVPVGTFACNCGFIYSRKGTDATHDDKFKIGRIKEFGHVWDRELLRLKKEEKLNQRQISLRMKCDPTTVKNQLKRLEEGAVKKVHMFISSENERIKRRSNWLNLMESNPEMTKTDLRKIQPKDFTWLYKYDQQWLEENSPTLRRGQKYADKRVDWGKRDEELSKKVKLIIDEELSGKMKPIRICVSSIGKKVGRLALLQKHIEKLPLTMTVIETYAESIDDIQVRRVKWVANQLRAKRESLEDWKIIREAGLRKSHSQRVAEQIEVEVMCLK